LDAILEIHNKNGYLSEAFARNILVNADHKFTFIDFETDPGQILDLQSCHIRDWLCFIFSTAALFTESELKQVSQIFIDKILPASKTYIGILKIGHKLRWARILKFEKIGNDGRRLQQCALFFKALEQQKALPMI